MKTLKYEEVYRQEYRDLAEARASLACFIDKVYNQGVLHRQGLQPETTALGARLPAAVKLADELLALLKADLFSSYCADPAQIQVLECQLVSLRKLRAAALIDEYRWWLHHPV